MNRLKQLRIDRGLTLAEVGEAVGVSKQALSYLENNGGGRPSTLKALGDFFDVPASSLLAPTEPEDAVA